MTEFATHMLNVQVKLKDDYQEVLYLTLILTGALPENLLYEIRPLAQFHMQDGWPSYVVNLE